MTVIIKTIDGRSYATHLTERELHQLLQAIAAKEAYVKLNGTESAPTYIIVNTISSITPIK